MGLIHIFQYTGCGHSSPEVERVCSACPDGKIRCCQKLRIIRSSLESELCSVCFLDSINVRKDPPALKENCESIGKNETDESLSSVLGYLTKNPLDPCKVPDEALGPFLTSALCYLYWTLSQSYSNLLQKKRTPTQLHCNIVLHIREILERFTISQNFAQNFPPSRKEYLLHNKLTHVTEPTIDNEEVAYCCSICRDHSTTKHPVRTQCGHEFGEACLLKWLKRNSSCPTCGREILEIFHDKQDFKDYIDEELFNKPEQIPTWVYELLGSADGTLSEGMCELTCPFKYSATCQKVDPNSLGKEVLVWFEEKVCTKGPNEDNETHCSCKSCR